MELNNGSRATTRAPFVLFLLIFCCCCHNLINGTENVTSRACGKVPTIKLKRTKFVSRIKLKDGC